MKVSNENVKEIGQVRVNTKLRRGLHWLANTLYLFGSIPWLQYKVPPEHSWHDGKHPKPFQSQSAITFIAVGLFWSQPVFQVMRQKKPRALPQFGVVEYHSNGTFQQRIIDGQIAYTYVHGVIPDTYSISEVVNKASLETSSVGNLNPRRWMEEATSKLGEDAWISANEIAQPKVISSSPTYANRDNRSI